MLFDRVTYAHDHSGKAEGQQPAAEEPRKAAHGSKLAGMLRVTGGLSACTFQAVQQWFNESMVTTKTVVTRTRVHDAK